MKRKFALVSLLMLFMVLSYGDIFASTVKCDNVPIYCNYQGLFNDIDNAEEEFIMLLEPPKHANFHEMYSALLYIVGCSRENDKYVEALKNPDCKVSAYTQKLVRFYESNATEFSNDEEKEEIVTLFEMLKKGDGSMFFNKG